MISAIVAIAQNGVIGRNNALPWHIPEDLKYFKQKTLGGVLIMGRKTFESFKTGPLPHRYHVVITRNPEPKALPPSKGKEEATSKTSVSYVGSMEKALDAAREVAALKRAWALSHLPLGETTGDQPHGEFVSRAEEEKTETQGPDIFVIGGREIYLQALPYLDRIYLTLIHRNYEGDTTLPLFTPHCTSEETKRLLDPTREGDLGRTSTAPITPIWPQIQGFTRLETETELALGRDLSLNEEVPLSFLTFLRESSKKKL